MADAEEHPTRSSISRITEELCPDGRTQDLRPDAPTLLVAQYTREPRFAVAAVLRLLYNDGCFYVTELPGDLTSELGGWRVRRACLPSRPLEGLLRKVQTAAHADLRATYDVSSIQLGKYHVGECFGCQPFDMDIVLWVDGCRRVVSVNGVDQCTMQILANHAEPWCAILAKHERDTSPLVQRQRRLAALPPALKNLLLAAYSLRPRGGSILCKGKECFTEALRLPYQEEWSELPLPPGVPRLGRPASTR